MLRTFKPDGCLTPSFCSPPPPPRSLSSEVAAGHYFTVARNLWGELFGWGAAAKGQLGTGKAAAAFPHPLPGLPPGQNHYEQVRVG